MTAMIHTRSLYRACLVLFPSQQHKDASAKYPQPRHLEEGEYLAQHCKEANTPLKNGSSAGKGSRRKKVPSMGDAHPWPCALLQTAANIEAMLMSGRLMNGKVHAPDVRASATPCPAWGGPQELDSSEPSSSDSINYSTCTAEAGGSFDSG